MCARVPTLESVEDLVVADNLKLVVTLVEGNDNPFLAALFKGHVDPGSGMMFGKAGCNLRFLARRRQVLIVGYSKSTERLREGMLSAVAGATSYCDFVYESHSEARRRDMEERLADLLLSLYASPGQALTGQVGYVDEYGRVAYGNRQDLAAYDVVRHVRGSTYLAVTPLQPLGYGKASSLAVDLDSTDLALVQGVQQALRHASIPFVPNFSGNKGYHFNVFFSRRVGRKEHDAIRDYVEEAIRDSTVGSLLKERGIQCDPRSAAQITSLPCGVHPLTNNRTDLLCPETGEILDTEGQIALLENPPRLDVEQFRIQLEESPADSVQRLRSLHWRQCVNLLYEHGVVRDGTRRSATLVIASAIKNNRHVSASAREVVMEEWIRRTFPTWHTSKTLEFALRDGKDALNNVNARFKPTCKVGTFRDGLKSVCDPAVYVNCIMHNVNRQQGTAKWCEGLEQAGIWGKMGHAKNTVYRSLTRLTDEDLTYNGMPVVCWPCTVIAENAGVSTSTVSRALKKFVECGLIIPVPSHANDGWRSAQYAIPSVDGAVLMRLIQNKTPNSSRTEEVLGLIEAMAA